MVEMRDETPQYKVLESNHKKLLNKMDPLDNLILDLVSQGKLKLGTVGVKEGNKNSFKDYTKRMLLHRGKHTS
jgi:hypothetical protein